MPEPHTWVLQLLRLGETVWKGEKPVGLFAKRASFIQPLVILSGGTARVYQANIDRFRQVVLDAFYGFTGTLISGGTRAGVAGLAGEIAVAEHAQKGGRLEVLGYLPRGLPDDQSADSRYTEWVPSKGLSFGPMDALQYWTDLLFARVKPQDVRVLAIDGGHISAFEYRLAIALGASVGVMEPAMRAASDLLADPDWRDCSGLVGLPGDARSVRAFIGPKQSA